MDKTEQSSADYSRSNTDERSNVIEAEEASITFDGKVVTATTATTAASSVAPMNASERQAEAAERQREKANNGPSPLDSTQIAHLMGQGYSRGMAHSLNDTKRSFPLRYWIIDNSGSMQMHDGHRFVSTSNRANPGAVTTKSCSRWEELSDCVKYHIKLAGLIEAPTIFRFLNKPNGSEIPEQFSVAHDNSTTDGDILRDINDGLKAINSMQPFGSTPLQHHMERIRDDVRQMADQLRANGERVVITIATDGLPTDTTRDGFVRCLRRLEGLPVWVVIRLCTDEDDIVQYYNDLDEQLELSIEVLDDFYGEAKEVTDENPWVNYTLQLHRLREFGYHDRVFDLLDERLLTKTELRDYCSLLFHDTDGMPDPSLDWKGFIAHVEFLLRKEPSHWNPVLKTNTPLLLMQQMKRNYATKAKPLRAFRKKIASILHVHAH